MPDLLKIKERFDVTCAECGRKLKVPIFYDPYYCATCRLAFKTKQRLQPSTMKERDFLGTEKTAQAQTQ